MHKNAISNTDAVIWGTGLWGYTAYYFYRKKCNIICYIDSNEQKWGSLLNGIKICSPDILEGQEVKVIVAMRNGVKDVSKRLREEFNMKSYTVFKIQEEIQAFENCNQPASEELQEDTCIVVFSGGLGNQMFQYAFLRNLEVQGKAVRANLEACLRVGGRGIQLTNIFESVSLKTCTQEQQMKLVDNNVKGMDKGKNFVIFTEAQRYEAQSKKADLSLLNITGGIILGAHQTYQYAERIRDVLLEDFRFNLESEGELKILRDKLMSENAISVHIRRGDYLEGNNQFLYGGICTAEYYETAMNYITERESDCTFYFFSNDIEWVKEHYSSNHAVYVEEKMFEHYKDWYDMYLMSVCKHNIIANSTFSWWGAWLNQNRKKIVIAPKKWINTCDYEDIYPQEWVQI